MGLTNRQSKFSNVPPSVSVKTIVFSWKLFTSHLTPSSVAVLPSHSTLFTIPGLLPEEMGGKSGEGRVDVNLGQLSVQYLQLSELFVSAAESFIITGSRFSKSKARLSFDRAAKETEPGKIKRKA